MSRLFRLFTILFVGIVSLSLAFGFTSASATPTQRGFQVPIGSLTAENLDSLVATWGINIIRVQIGDDIEMDHTTGPAYDAMMSRIFDMLDAKLPLLQERGIKMIFCLYSPPGGFQTRQAPSHYRMFSRPDLQKQFIRTWRTIMTRFGSHPSIEAFDLVNEPAARSSLMGPRVKPWNRLARQTIAAIRETHPSKTVIVKSLYGDPSRLTRLPAFSDPNVIYSYNSYLYSGYQHSGITSAPYSLTRPADDAILRKTRSRLAPFFRKIHRLVEKGALPPTAYPPKILVGEAAVSACALEGAGFLQGLLTALETDDSQAGIVSREATSAAWRSLPRAERVKTPKPAFSSEDFLLDVQHAGYAIHAFGEYPLWDPRYTCGTNGSFALSNTETDRSATLKAFFALNS